MDVKDKIDRIKELTDEIDRLTADLKESLIPFAMEIAKIRREAGIGCRFPKSRPDDYYFDIRVGGSYISIEASCRRDDGDPSDIAISIDDLDNEKATLDKERAIALVYKNRLENSQRKIDERKFEELKRKLGK